ncbi:membrane protein [Marivirga tractuosa]|uniref:OmpA/MotB domain protein n=1 Tax=Marivirga tractuosa (strain ATCC 23168 / DSM 4126 / NBRC 15989 / NCIMB 1408 / VKM B-1430 / H-43) TaxID=643867 RepID=E4TKH7_MARTH|nr:OmpA family protein [Marivirga tractuosa]ADR20157.1 OmpA/MotB domain protein [Marivirga tractuosa DSM 4126]BDD15402.1 membrane protein [Marivirga tractuosa]
MRVILFVFISFFLTLEGVSQDKPVLIDSLESIYDDISPVISPDGITIYFTKKNHPENKGGERDLGDIWYAESQNGVWNSAKRLPGPVNNTNFNAVIGITPDGNIMYVVGNYKSPRKGGVSYSRKIGENWSEPQPIDIPYFKNKSDHLSGSLSKDGKIMVLSLESFGTRGNEDIYYTFRKSIDEWTELRNLGVDINTEAQELTPYLAKDNKTLFFSSNGRGGKGSRDVFYSKRQDATWTTWSKVKNLENVNTEGADWYFRLIEETDKALLVNTVNSIGLGNILMTKTPNEVDIEPEIEKSMTASSQSVLPFKNNSNTSKTREKIKVKFEVVDGFSGNTLTPQLLIKGVNEMSKSSYSEIVMGKTSSYQTKLFKDSIYTIDISVEGYLDDKQTIKTDSIEDNSTVKLELLSLKEGTTIQLKSVLFKRGTSEIKDGSFEELDRVYTMLKKNPTVEIELAGHTDNTGSAKLNIELSQKRSDKIKEYLVEKGINPKRLQSKGYGGARPIASNKSEATRKLNRRVEFTIIKI